MDKRTADIVIIGSGASGLAAAISAAEKQAKVIVLEKKGRTGGTANMGMGPLAVGSRYQKAQMVDLTVDDAVELLMTYTHWEVDARLVQKYYAQSADTIEWLENMGVEFLGAYKYFEKSQQTWHLIKPTGGGGPAEGAGSAMVRAMTARAEELGVEFLLKTPVRRILNDGGRIHGVEAVTADGEDILIESRCVIVATGGFGDNPEMIRENIGLEWGKNLFSFRIPGLDGDGIHMAWDVGAGKSKMLMEISYTTPGVTDIYRTLSETMRQPNLMVNLEGKRIFNEEKMNNNVFTGNALKRQTGQCGFTVIGEDTVDYYRRHGLDYISVVHKIRDMEKWDSELEAYLGGGPAKNTTLGDIANKAEYFSEKHFFAADSIRELARLAGIDADALEATVDEYNRHSGSKDPMFNKNPEYMLPITGKRFYAARHYPAGYGTLGGVKVNDDLQVVTQDGQPIDGLYSCGTDACALFGDSYCFLLPGNTMGFALNSGRIAGRNAADRSQ